MASALITGASSGVGLAIATSLAKSDYRVMAMGRDRDRLAELAGHPGITSISTDLTDREALVEIVSELDIDVLVNNAGMMPPLAPFHETRQDDLDQAIQVNFAAQVALTRLVVPGMVERGSGHVIFTGSTAGHAAFQNMAVYCATKAALGAFAQSLRLDLADYGIRVTEIVAGRVQTALYRDVLSDEVRHNMYAGGGTLQPQNIADMVLAILALPPEADVARFDIVPTKPAISAANRS